MKKLLRKIAFGPSEEDQVRELLETRIAELERTDPNASSHRYHVRRYIETLARLPRVSAEILDLGGALGLFGEILPRFRPYRLSSGDAAQRAHPFDFDRDPFPFANSSFDIVLFMEVLEHLREDPMHALCEINRILRDDGLLVLTTPNIASWKSIRRALRQENPALFPPYMRNGGTDRHNREYTFAEVLRFVEDGGFRIEQAEAVDVYDHVPGAEPIPGFDAANRGDTTFCIARKSGSPKERRPGWLYWPA